MKQNLVESRKSKVESQEPRGKRRKHKVVKWEYVTKPFDVKVLPNLFKRLHAPLVPWLSSLTENCHVHLRPCVQGIDEDGAVVKYLYCTRDGRFFVRDKDGWCEQKINYAPNRPSVKIGRCHSTYPTMRHFGGKFCHQCVAYAWHGARPEGKVCDHLDTNLLNFNADNIEWVTIPENNRRGMIARRMRKSGLDPKLLTPTLLRGIYSLPDDDNDWIGVFIGIFMEVCSSDPSPLSAEAIRLDVAKVLDVLKKYINEGKGLPLQLTKEQLNNLGL